jgi:hypothetical protein
MLKNSLILLLALAPAFAQAGHDARHAPGSYTFTNAVRVSVGFATENNPDNRAGTVSPANTADTGYKGSYAKANVFGTYTIQCPQQGYGFVEHVNIVEEVTMNTGKTGAPVFVYGELKSFECELNDYGG